MSAAHFSFSHTEYDRRRAQFEAAMEASGVVHAICYGANRSGSAIPWLTNWPVTREAHLVLTVGEQPILLVNFFNHVPDATRSAVGCDVRWGGERPIETVRALLLRRAPGRIGVVGPLPYDQHQALAEATVSMDGAHTALRQIKSAEEISALRQAAALTDLSVAALVADESLGATEHELSARMESAYVARGGGHHIHYLSVTSMSQPDRCVPAQWPTARRLSPGDLLSFELSASAAPDYSGQLLRTFTVGAPPSARVAELHAVAEAALQNIEAILRPGVLPDELVTASEVIEQAGYTTLDDLIHGFGGGYLPPILGSRGRTNRPPGHQPLAAGMTIVVQPNVVLPDKTLGVQTGELLLITPTGFERLHSFPRGLGRIA